MSKSITILLEDYIHKDLKIECAKKEQTLKSYVTDAIIKKLSEDNDKCYVYFDKDEEK